MRIAGINGNDMINGEGVSVSLWMQGCPFHCKGCHNSETWDFNGGEEISYNILINTLLDLISANDIQRNFSILGGEPLAPSNFGITNKIMEIVKDKFPGIKIFLWTGYTFEELRNNKYYNHFLNNCPVDVLITGRYIEEERDITLKWRGSRNQKILYKGKDF